MFLLLISAVLMSVLCSAVQYSVNVRTGDEKYAGTDDIVKMWVENDSGEWTNLGPLNIKSRDDNERDSTNLFLFKKRLRMSSIGKGVKCVVLYIEGDDKWLLDWISVTIRSGHFAANVHYEDQVFVNTDKIWLSTDLSEGVSSLKMCSYCVNCL